MTSTNQTLHLGTFLKVTLIVGAVMASTSAFAQQRASSSLLMKNARQSPLFEAKIPASQLKARGLDRIEMGDAVYLNLGRYVEQSRLTKQPKLKALFQPSVQQRFLKAKPVYNESILKLQDRIVIERELTVPIKPGTCARSDTPKAIDRLCFKRSSGAISNAVAADLDAIRAKLAAAPPTRKVKAGVTAAEAMQLDDTALMELLLNSDTRTIRRTSVIPLRTYNSIAGIKNIKMTNFSAQLPRQKPLTKVQRPQFSLAAVKMESAPAANMQRAVSSRPARPQMTERVNLRKAESPRIAKIPKGQIVRAPVPMEVAERPDFSAIQDLSEPVYADPIKYGDRYFLTGFTIGREISDEYEFEIAEETWLTDRYFIRLSYRVSLGFGLRIPFSFSTRISPVIGESDDRRLVEVSVDPVNVDRNGQPAYPRVGLDESQYFDGDEFVMELTAGVALYASIPGPNIDLQTPRIGFDQSKNFDPVIGNQTSHIGHVVLVPASLSGLEINAGVGGAGIDIGLSAELSDGEIGMNTTHLGNTKILGNGERRYEFHNRNTQTFTIKPKDPDEKFGFAFFNPTYAATVGIAPFIQPYAYVDVGSLEASWRMDPLTIDALTVSLDFDLDRHDGTRSNYGFSVQPVSR